MDLIKCGLCGFEFERGAKICRGCQGRIEYGAGGISLIFGLVYGGLFWFALNYIDNHFFNVDDYMTDKAFLISVFVVFFIGVFHAFYIFRNRVETVKERK